MEDVLISMNAKNIIVYVLIGALILMVHINVNAAMRFKYSRFKLSDDKLTCEDIDECAEFEKIKSGIPSFPYMNLPICRGICTNTEGSYYCQCPPGYEKRNHICTDINECERTPSLCRGADSTCLNTAGSHKCFYTRCPPGYVKDDLNKDNRKFSIIFNTGLHFRCVQKRDEYQHKDECPLEHLDVNIPLSISYRYITFTPKVFIPRGGLQFFHFGFDCGYCSNVEFSYEVRSLYSGHSIEKASKSNFKLEQTGHNAVLYLMREIKGEQDVELKLIAKTFAPQKATGFHEVKIHIVLALTQQDCPSFTQENKDTMEIEAKIDCCHSCALGINAGKQGYDCNPSPHFGQLFSASFQECCEKFKRENAKLSTGLCRQNNTCEQICEDFGSFDKLECRCNSGFKLANDGRRCMDIDECYENTHDCGKRENCVNYRGTYTCVDKQNTEPRRTDCPPGYNSDSRNSSICVDVDECADGTQKCNRETAYCENFKGGYRCVEHGTGIIEHKCPIGHTWIETSCVDIDECIRKEHNCVRRKEACVNVIGSYRCVQLKPCPAGYIYSLQSQSCEDDNECEEQDVCQKYQKCENTVGSFNCVCDIGFKLDRLTNECVDINECQINTHNCESNRRCDNTIGSFECVRELSCGTGYTFNSDTNVCEDDDECTLGTHNCVNGFVCKNIQGSFLCEYEPCPLGFTRLTGGACVNNTCPIGFKFDRRSERCEDINECLTVPCLPSENCKNTLGSYYCIPNITCSQGLFLNKVTQACEDIDECEVGTHNCSFGQKCHNTHGSYSCSCPPGFLETRAGYCEDINECESGFFTCHEHNSICENTVGSYKCDCKPGFRNSERGTCIDIDECHEIADLCSHSCANTYGSYLCKCQLGYTLQADGRSCVDIDECENPFNRSSTRFLNTRLCMGHCRNTQGSYKCECPSGYRMGPDGHSCIDIDECKEYSVCKNADDTCLNTRGGYKCYPLECPGGYYKDRSHKTRCVRPERNSGKADLSTPVSYSFNYITMPSNVRIPPSGKLEMITIRGPLFMNVRAEFDLKLEWAQARNSVSQVNRDFFMIQGTGFNEAKMYLKRSIEGPQEVKLDLGIKMFHNGYFGGESRAIVFITVSEYDF
ncbi:hypothetical protein B4U80_04230 [Leptotrombidium deliense]|uniref:EGF-like domain-containing protein n=1 Tax=Leptotrombidium deliense TaxID=299467 RepID=A0A443SRL8_9ACAR|nr:hypothetical protein B4U80_04230 [Leptotrombidium deliense]